MANLQEAFKRLDQFIANKRNVVNIPALVVAVTDREKLMFETTHGYADVAARIPITPDKLFQIGSIGKSFTSISILQLMEEEILDLHEPVTRYLPWFEVQSKYGPITLHHLLSHTAGIVMGADFPGDPHYEVWSLRETEATAPPGTYFHYSNTGYKTLGVILEELLDQPLGDIIRARILDPLGMSATKPIVTNDLRSLLAVGYEAFYDDRPMPPGRPLAPATWLEHAEGAGSIASTAADMAVYLRMLMNRGVGPKGRILSEESFKLMTTPVIAAEEEGDGSFYGYGLSIRKADSHNYLGHSGGMVGYYAYILMDMDDGLGVVVLMNGPGEQSDEEIANYALELTRAAIHDQKLPGLPPASSAKLDNVEEYCGNYKQISEKTLKTDKTIVLESSGEPLFLLYGSERIALEPRGKDCFYVEHPEFAIFPLRLGREDGKIVEAFHGTDWYINDHFKGATSFKYPKEWDAYPGHYLSHNPWSTNFRVILRKGELLLVEPSGEEQLLTPLGKGVFRVGKDERSPERLRFDAVINGLAFRANLSCVESYRRFKG
jgi:CubicO group peptidase (beta-lactamase class C family)